MAAVAVEAEPAAHAQAAGLVAADGHCECARPRRAEPLAFPPSYMRKPAQPPPPEQSQGASNQGGGPPKALGGPAPPTALGFEGKRCPSWCDRVMMSANGLDLVKKSRAAAAYDSQLWLPCFSDHNKVYLSFSCA